MLYDNEDQLEVRHHISLAHYQTDIYAGGDRIPEGELWIKRNCMLPQLSLAAWSCQADPNRHKTGSEARRRHIR